MESCMLSSNSRRQTLVITKTSKGQLRKAQDNGDK
jgi:hypothetical protein